MKKPLVKKPELGKPIKRVCPKQPKPVPYDKPIKLGSFGPDVAYACVMLRKHGSTLKPTDKFHIGMRSAVVGFQKKNKLKTTGVIDKKTWDKLSK